MAQLKELLIEQLEGLLDAETQLTRALPKMAEAANNEKLKEALEHHLHQTQGHVERLRKVLQNLGESAEAKPCRAMTGLIEEGQEIIDEGSEKEPLAADLALIAAAQKVEHYEISGYGTARSLARQIGEMECARMLTHTLGEEESADFLLTSIADPLLQQATLDDKGADTNLESATGEKRGVPAGASARRKTPSKR